MKWEAELGMLTTHAASLHVKHTRKGPRKGKNLLRVPYIVHPLQVLQRVQRWGIDEDTPENRDFWRGILYHDSIEDTTATYDYLIGLIGKRSADIVMELTHTMDEDGEDYMQSFAEKSIEAVVAKVADRLCNVEDFFLDSPNYAWKYMQKANAVLLAFQERGGEVTSRFGKEVYQTIMADIGHVNAKVSKGL